MQTETALPCGKDPSYFRHVALISGGFFLFVRLVLLEGMPARLGFTVLFAGFLLAGLWLSDRSRRTWPQKVVINREGISLLRPAGAARRRFGVAPLIARCEQKV